MFLLYGRQYPVLWAPLHDTDAEGSPYTRKESMLVHQRSLNRESWTEDIADSLNWTWCSVVPTSWGHSGLFSFFFFAELILVSSRPHRVPLSSVPADTVSTRCSCYCLVSEKARNEDGHHIFRHQWRNIMSTCPEDAAVDLSWRGDAYSQSEYPKVSRIPKVMRTTGVKYHFWGELPLLNSCLKSPPYALMSAVKWSRLEFLKYKSRTFALHSLFFAFICFSCMDHVARSNEFGILRSVICFLSLKNRRMSSLCSEDVRKAQTVCT